MADYFTLETVRDQLMLIGTLGETSGLGTFPHDWGYCPCIIIESCARLDNKTCSKPVFVGVYIRTPNISMPIVVEIIYERETHRGFIRANQMKINQLIENGVLNIEKLEKASF